MSGAFQQAKFENLILHLAEACDLMASWGRTKLAKLLFYCDFTCHERYGRPVTGATYRKMPNGPVPDEMYSTLQSLGKRGMLAEIERQVGDFHEKRPTALTHPDLSVFAPEEILVVSEVLERYGKANATQLSRLSHKHPGWVYAQANEVIPYYMALQGIRKPTPDELDWIRSQGS